MQSYETTGTCAKRIDFEISGGIVTECKFIGGCPGNTVGVARMVVGRPVSEVISTLKGIICPRSGSTSCPDQLAQALEKATQQQ